MTVGLPAPGTPGPSLIDSSSSVTPPPPPSMAAPAVAPLGKGRIRLEPTMGVHIQTAAATPPPPPAGLQMRSKVESILAPPPARTAKGAPAPGGVARGGVPVPGGGVVKAPPPPGSGKPVQPARPARPPPKRTSAELGVLMDSRLATAVASACDITSFINRSKRDRVANTLALLGLPAGPSVSAESRKPAGVVRAVAAAASGTVKAEPGVAVKAEPGVAVRAGAPVKLGTAPLPTLARALAQGREPSAAQREFHVTAGRVGKRHRRAARSASSAAAAVRRAVAAEAQAAAVATTPLGLHVEVDTAFGLPVVVGALPAAPVPVPRIRLQVAGDYPRGGASYTLEYEPAVGCGELLRAVDVRIAQCRTRALGAGVGVGATLAAWAAAAHAWAEAQASTPPAALTGAAPVGGPAAAPLDAMAG